MKPFLPAFGVVFILFYLVAIGASSLGRAAEKKPALNAKPITYDEHIKPILRAKCFGCHNPDKTEGDLNLTSYSSLRVGGGSGEILEPGDAGASYLWSLVTHESQPHMPPKQNKLPKQMLDLIRVWIEGGALEHSGSKFVRKGPKFDFTLADVPNQRPMVQPMPSRLVLEPVV